MKPAICVLGWLLISTYLLGQGAYSLTVNSSRQLYCTPTQVATLTAQARTYSAVGFTAIKYHFYYFSSGLYQEIGYYQVSNIGGTLYTYYGNILGYYFDGSQIQNAQQIPLGGGNLWINIDVPYVSFPNNHNGQQLTVDIEAIDQNGSTTTRSAMLNFAIPLLYTNPIVLSSTAISTNSSILCGNTSVQISGAPNMATYGFRYDWYKDGSAVSVGESTGTLSANSAGSYYAIVNDVCQSATSNTLVLTKEIAPGKPVVSSSNGSFLCNGLATQLSTTPTAGGTIYWNTGATGNSITVSTAGEYYCWEINGCGQGSNSDPIVISTGSTPAAPVISSSAGTLLCNGSSSTLLATGITAAVNWSTGQSGNSISVAAAGSYYAYQSNSCGTSTPSNTISISTGTTPVPLNISSSNGTFLCNGAATNLTASGVEGIVIWSTGQTGNVITVTTAGTYNAYQTASCGTSTSSNSLIISTGNTPVAPSITSNNGTLLCNGSSSVLSAAGIDGTVSWSTGQTGSSISVGSAGTYYAYQSNSCGTSANSNMLALSANITPAAPVVSSNNGSFLCNGASTVLSTAPAHGGIIQWNTGQTGNTITVSSAGSYYAWEQNDCGNSPNSNQINILTGNSPAAPTITPGNNQLLCNGASATLSAIGSDITWSTSQTGNSLTVSSAGTYYAYDHNSCGNSFFSNQVVIATGNCPIPVPGTSYTICPGTLKTLDAGTGFESYLWSNGATTQTISVGPGSYSVTVMKNGCYASSAVVTVSYFTVTIPIITPSGSTIFCSGGSVTLSASSGMDYLWNTGATGSSITVTAAGTYSVSVTDNNGCQVNSPSISTVVTSLPGASISGNTEVCQNSPSPSITLSGSGGSAPYTFTYRINGGAEQDIATITGNSVSLIVPTTSVGNYSVSLVRVREASSTACTGPASGTAAVLVNPLPQASITGTTTVCQNASAPSIGFSGSNGTAPYTFVYRINGGAAQTITTSSGNSINIAVPTGSAGTYVYSLVGVSDASNGSCANAASGSVTITVNPLPTASVSGNALVCQNGSEPVISFAGSNGTAPYTFTYAINGGSQQVISTTSGFSANLSAPTDNAGNFSYELISVRDASVTACSSAANGSVVVMVNPLPVATITGSRSVCQNSPSPVVQLTGSGGTAPYTFIYQVNGGASQSIRSVSGSSIELPVSTATPGIITYSLLGIQDASSTSCAAASNGSATIVVNSLPFASLSGDTAVCQSSQAPSIRFASAGGTAPYTFTYRVNDGANQTITTITGSSVSLIVPTQAAGSFSYRLISVQDGSTTACTNQATGEVTVTVYPQPDAAVITTSETHLCNGSAGVIRILNHLDGNSYQWYFNQFPLRKSTRDTLVNENPGVFSVRSISRQGCSAATVSNEIKFSTGTVTTPVILGSKKVCEGGKSQLMVTSLSKPYELWRWADPPDTGRVRKIYSWDNSFFAEAGQYQVWVMREGCYDSTIVTITADDTEYPAGRLTLFPLTIAYGSSVQLTADVSPADQFHWDFGDGTKTITNDSMVRQYYYQAADSLLVQLEAVSPRNCRTHFSGWLRVLPEPIMPKNEVYGGGNLKDWNVFPIPFQDQLKISVVLNRKQEVRIELFSGEGRRLKSWVKTGVQGENLFQLETIGELRSGVVYFITAIYNNEKHFAKVFKSE